MLYDSKLIDHIQFVSFSRKCPKLWNYEICIQRFRTHQARARNPHPTMLRCHRNMNNDFGAKKSFLLKYLHARYLLLLCLMLSTSGKHRQETHWSLCNFSFPPFFPCLLGGVFSFSCYTGGERKKMDCFSSCLFSIECRNKTAYFGPILNLTHTSFLRWMNEKKVFEMKSLFSLLFHNVFFTNVFSIVRLLDSLLFFHKLLSQMIFQIVNRCLSFLLTVMRTV